MANQLWLKNADHDLTPTEAITPISLEEAAMPVVAAAACKVRAELTVREVLFRKKAEVVFNKGVVSPAT